MTFSFNIEQISNISGLCLLLLCPFLDEGINDVEFK